MPFESAAAMVGGNLDNTVKSKIAAFLKLIDKHIAEISRAKGLFPAQVRLLQPLNYCVFVSDQDVFIVVSNQNVGGMPRQQFVDWTGKDINMQAAVFIVQRDLAFEKSFGLSFKKGILDLGENEQEEQAKGLCGQYIHDEILNLERLQGIVRINPIFQGRDFLINESLVFVLSPFSKAFNTIFNDHIKTTVENIENYTCIRADDIYDNRPIIEDVWKSINEARIIISELTGRNPNVFYETGIAHTVGKEVILLTQSIDDVPFDLKHLRCIVYDYTPRGVPILETELRNTIEAITRRG